MCFFQVFRDSLFFLKYLQHFRERSALNVVYTLIITKSKVIVSHLWKYFNMKYRIKEHLQKR